MNVDARPKWPMTRRRFISVLAATAAVSLVPRGLGSADPKTFTWEGVALGAHARLTLQHPDEAHAKAAIATCLTEVARLEAIFSLTKSTALCLGSIVSAGSTTLRPSCASLWPKPWLSPG
jgi:hypothetical protein